MKVRAFAISVLAACALATSAAPAGAIPDNANASCVGQFASSFATNQDYPGQYGEFISEEEAQFYQPFGANRVSPFAHTDRDNCFDG